MTTGLHATKGFDVSRIISLIFQLVTVPWNSHILFHVKNGVKHIYVIISVIT